MGSPVTTARGIPAGRRLRDGFKTTVAFAVATTASIWERTVKAPGIQGGEFINTTTMLNEVWRQFATRQLVTLTDLSIQGGYDPRCYVTFLSIINVEGSITVHFPDNSTLDFFGALRDFEPNDKAEGTFPEARFVIGCTNTDPADGSEASPVYKTSNGTILSP